MSFDILAPHYTWMEKVLAGSRLQRCRIRWLPDVAEPQRVLILGVGHGHFLRACARRFPQAEIVSVDASARMLERAQANVAEKSSRLKFIHARLPEWTPEPESYDVISTHFFLDCFPPDELARVVASVAGGARASAAWLVADFAIPARGWSRVRARAIHAGMYAFFRPVTGVRARRVTPPDALLQAHGFQLVRRASAEWGLLHSDLWQRP